MPDNNIVGIFSPPYEEQRIADGQRLASKKNVHWKEWESGRSYNLENPDNIGNLKHQPQELDFDITKYHKCLEPLEWHGCYDGDGFYKQFVTPESYAHPAKASFLLIERILKHLEKLELLKEGMTIADVMAGSGRIPLLASLRGYNSVSVELEPHFIKMIEDNKKKAEKITGRKLPMQIIQGDSRKLSSLINNSNVGIFSPPFEQSDNRGNSFNNRAYPKLQRRKWDEWEMGYGNTEGNIGNLKYKDNDFVGVFSPPYIKQQKGAGIQNHKESCECNFCKKNKNNAGNIQGYKDIVGVFSPPYQDTPIAQQGTKKGWNESYLKYKESDNWQDFQEQMSKHNKEQGYSQNPQNIGNLKDVPIVGITSPPYADAPKENRVTKNQAYEREGRINVNLHSKYFYREKVHSEENIANLKDTSSIVGITSPPYENQRIAELPTSMSNGGLDILKVKDKSNISNRHKTDIPFNEGENYLSAMLQIYQECAKTMPIICTITKNPTRNGKLRRLDLDTARLLELSGYQIMDYHRAILFKDIEQQTLTGSTKKEYKGRLSFFKRLSLSKGNVASQWEDVIIGVRI